jgi:hypothetical protein
MNQFSELAAQLDPATLLECAGVIPDPWQANVLRSASRRLLLLCSRQCGKSTVTSALALHTVLYQPEALVLLLSPSLRQSKLLFRSVMKLYDHIRGATTPENESTLGIELRNGSRIEALPGNEETIRGFGGVNLLVIDEAARVDDDLYRSVRPMLAVNNGRMVCLSTPWGKRGFFYECWTKGEEWERTKVTAPECPRIPASFLAEEKRSLPDSWYRQEYLCEFADTEGAVFRYDDIMAAMRQDVEPLFPIEGLSDEEPLFS